MAVAGAALALVACTSGPRGLGKGACPYLRPRLIRLDTDRLHLPGALPDLTALSEDVSDYVRTNLPDGGKAKSDRPLVRFSGALTAFVGGGGVGGGLAASEQAVAHECAVRGY
jgi:hypothetical protein